MSALLPNSQRRAGGRPVTGGVAEDVVVNDLCGGVGAHVDAPQPGRWPRRLTVGGSGGCLLFVHPKWGVGRTLARKSRTGTPDNFGPVTRIKNCAFGEN